MKRMIWCAGFLLLLCANALSQTKSKKGPVKQQPPQTVSSNKQTTETSNTITLNSNSSYSAKTNTGLSTWKSNYTVSDPLLTILDARANGANIQFNNSGIVGMPKRAYGFADGHIVLNSTGAVTSGTQTGSGAVGTGTSLATFGTTGAPMKVNGKSPYAGTSMWGNSMNLPPTKKDSLLGGAASKKQ
jgi:hypothetical protein